jgi:butyryl-CoA dehydrogenase
MGMCALFDEDHLALRKAASEFADRVIKPVAASVDRDDSFPRRELEELAGFGVFGLSLPAPHGYSRDLLSYVVTIEEISKRSASLGWLCVVQASCCYAVAATAESGLKNRLLPQLVQGSKLVTYAFTEPGSGANLAYIDTNLANTGENYVLRGTKSFITMAGEADVFIVGAKAQTPQNPAAFTMVAVEKSLGGVKTGSRYTGSGLRGISWGEVVFEDHPVASENLLGGVGGGFKTLGAMGKHVLLGAAAVSLGVAQAAYDSTIEHLRQRNVGGKPLGSNPVIQNTIADAKCKLDAARWLTYGAASDDDPRSTLHQEAKLYSTEAAVEITRVAVQLHGANGYTTALPVERYMRDSLAVTLHFDNNGLLRGFLGRSLVG